jgi:hypothetical protein
MEIDDPVVVSPVWPVVEYKNDVDVICTSEAAMILKSASVWTHEFD